MYQEKMYQETYITILHTSPTFINLVTGPKIFSERISVSRYKVKVTGDQTRQGSQWKIHGV